MLNVKIELERQFDYKDFLPTEKELKDILLLVGEQFIELFKKNVETQKTWANDTISENSPYWTAHKASEGYDLRSLIMKDRSFIDLKNWTIIIKDNKVNIKMNKNLKYKFYEVQKVGQELGKNYDEVMPDDEIEAELDWFDRKFEELVCKKIDEKATR